MGLTAANVLYGPFNLSLKNVSDTEIYGLTGLRHDAIKFGIETKEGNQELEDGKEVFWLDGRRLIVEVIVTQMDAKTGSITHFADAGAGQITVTSAAHGLSNGDYVTISGTTNYNGWFLVANVATNTFEITDTWVSDDATGTWVRCINTDIESTTITKAEIYIREKAKTITISSPDKIFTHIDENYKLRIKIIKTGDITNAMSDLMSLA